MYIIRERGFSKDTMGVEEHDGKDDGNGSLKGWSANGSCLCQPKSDKEGERGVLTLCADDIYEAQAVGSNLGALAVPVGDAGDVSWAIVGEGVLDQSLQRRSPEGALVRADEGRREQGAVELELDVQDADIAVVGHEGRCLRAVLRLYYIVGGGVDGGGRHVRRVTAGGAEGFDELGVVQLLRDGGRARQQGNFGAQHPEDDAAVVVGRDGNVVADDPAGRWPKGKGPLRVNIALGEGDDGDVSSGDARDVVDGVGHELLVLFFFLSVSVFLGDE